jgi:hypothetical protein
MEFGRVYLMPGGGTGGYRFEGADGLRQQPGPWNDRVARKVSGKHRVIQGYLKLHA